ncbi:DUF5677 domain-containing protein [Domibacillus sp. A3M-37]|uniref:DUF5677 domain-containing protein n=1 Tax=Domibacillus sp. A3M-37 TaxID=2962037 RepID=UPI0020B75B89|nr:DUF5677 domain-containing protein [Domibacillus sp. A3M-37]MCP3764073.1 DUF5677 domain-containing protein [Domibacillus sp. A3M-37]
MTSNLDELIRIYDQSVIEFYKVEQIFIEKTRKEEEIEYQNPIINLLLWNIIEKLDALTILFEHKIGKSSDSIFRDLFENYIYLFFMIKKDDARYARAYVYQTYLEEINELEKIISESQDEVNQIDEPITEKIEWLHSRINNESFTEIKREWEKVRKRRKYIKWYNLYEGPTSLKQLCEDLDYGYFYENIYSQLSYQTHSLNILNSLIDEGEDWGYLNHVRNGKDNDFRNVLSKHIATMALLQFVKYFHPSEKEYYKEVFLKLSDQNISLFP